MKKPWLYHYCNEENFNKFQQQRYIPASSPMTDEKFGTGVYLTGVPPQAHKKVIARNNYGSEKYENDPEYCTGNVTHYFRIHISQLKSAVLWKGKGTQRNIWLYPFDTLDLNQVEFESGKRPDYDENWDEDSSEYDSDEVNFDWDW